MRPLPMLARAARLRCPGCGLRFERDEENV
jgi:hypothetical protein